MRTFAKKQNRLLKAVSTPLARHNMSTAYGMARHADPILPLDRATDNEALQQTLHANVDECEPGLTGTASPRIGHDLRFISVYSRPAGAIQTKSAVNKPGDEYEQEADRISRQVMRMSEPKLPRLCARGGTWPRCQTEEPRQEHQGLQTKRVGPDDLEETPVPSIVHEVLASPGRPMDPAARSIMELRFGHDFSPVRVHTNAQAAGSARAINAHAYTVGRDLVFDSGRYSPNTNTGQRLLAHELAHVVQQGVGCSTLRLQRQGNDDDSLPVVRSTVLKAPPTFQQDALTCWAAAIASWLLVKAIVKQGFSDQFLIDYYEGTSCVDNSGALVGEDAIEEVFAEWRLAIDMGAEIQQDGFDAVTAERRLRQHGHFILGTGSGTLHAIVVYGIEVHSADDPSQYSLLVMDPILGINERKHHMFLDYPVRLAVGLSKSGGPAPCRRGNR